jgi:hypothetical protein
MRSLLALGLLALATTASTASTASAAPAPSGPPIFLDRAAATGIDFVHFNGMSGQNYMVEIMGAGAALLDYDNDGDLDLYLVQGGMLGPGKTLKDALHPPADSRPLTDRLYRNDLIRDGKPTGSLRFTDVTAQAGLALADYGQGVATGDFDNDGWIDLYRTAFGHNRLLRNTGQAGKGGFEDVTARAGVDDPRWSTSATFFDFDRDGWLDLFVVNYVDYPFDKFRPCVSDAGFVDYCGPLAYKPVASSLFRNRGNGTFQDVSGPSGIGAAASNGLGVVAADFDRDGWPDLYVANDAMPNHLWLNRKGTFAEEALLGGAAVSGEGKAQASMGVTAADFDGDDDDDLFVTTLTNEPNTLFVNNGGGLFNDETPRTGLGPPSLPFTKFGTLDFDYDNDGWLDLYVTNGWVSAGDESYVPDVFAMILRVMQEKGGDFSDARDWPPMGNKSLSGYQKKKLFHNEGGQLFTEQAARHGLDSTRDGRGLRRRRPPRPVRRQRWSRALSLSQRAAARATLGRVGARRHALQPRRGGGPGAPDGGRPHPAALRRRRQRLCRPEHPPSALRPRRRHRCRPPRGALAYG